MPTALMIAMVTMGGERQPSPPLVFSAAKEVLVAHVGSPFDRMAGRYGSSREIQMKGAHNINPIITLQQSELRPHAGIEIEEVTATVASIQTIIASHDALVPNGKTLRLLAAEAHHFEPNTPAWSVRRTPGMNASSFR